MPNSQEVQVRLIRIPAKPAAFKKEVETIVSHKTDRKCGVRFQVKWKGYQIFLMERSESIVKRVNGLAHLRNYLVDLQAGPRKNLNRWTHALRREPELANYLKEDEMDKDRDLMEVHLRQAADIDEEEDDEAEAEEAELVPVSENELN